MNIQGFTGISQTYGAYGTTWNKHGLTPGTASTSSDIRVTISEQVKAPLSESAITARLESIKAKPAMQRSGEDAAFVQANDKQLAGILSKDPQRRTANDINYMQKAGGLVNTMANLTASEKKLYDELVAKGDTEAVRGMNLIALSRMGDDDVTLPNGKTFSPRTTGITADNIRQLFSRMFVGSDGQDAKSFEALANYLESRAG